LNGRPGGVLEANHEFELVFLLYGQVMEKNFVKGILKELKNITGQPQRIYM